MAVLQQGHIHSSDRSKNNSTKSEISDIKISLANIISKERNQLLHPPFLFPVLFSLPVIFVPHCLRIL